MSQQEHERRRILQTAARDVRHVETRLVRGAGFFADPEPVRFPVSFAGEPEFTSGATIVDTPDLQQRHLVSAAVSGWVVTARGLVSGAFVHFDLDTSHTTGGDLVVIKHTLVFTGEGVPNLRVMDGVL